MRMRENETTDLLCDLFTTFPEKKANQLLDLSFALHGDEDDSFLRQCIADQREPLDTANRYALGRAQADMEYQEWNYGDDLRGYMRMIHDRLRERLADKGRSPATRNMDAATLGWLRRMRELPVGKESLAISFRRGMAERITHSNSNINHSYIEARKAAKHMKDGHSFNVRAWWLGYAWQLRMA